MAPFVEFDLAVIIHSTTESVRLYGTPVSIGGKTPNMLTVRSGRQTVSCRGLAVPGARNTQPQFREAGYRHSCFVVPHCISSPYTSATEGGSAWSRNRSRPCRHAMRSSLCLICDQGIITKQMYASYRYRSIGINGTTFLE